MVFEGKKMIACCLGSLLFYSLLILTSEETNYSYILNTTGKERQVAAWISSTLNIGNWTLAEHDDQYFKRDAGKIDLRLVSGAQYRQMNPNLYKETKVLNITSNIQSKDLNKDISGSVTQENTTITKDNNIQPTVTQNKETGLTTDGKTTITKTEVVQNKTPDTINQNVVNQNTDVAVQKAEDPAISNKTIFQKFRAQSIAQASSWSMIIKIRDGVYNDGHAYIINMSYGEAEYLQNSTKILFTSEKMVYPINPYSAFGNMNTNYIYKKVNNFALIREYAAFTFLKSYTCMMDITLNFSTTKETLIKDIETKNLEGSMTIKNTSSNNKTCFPDMTVQLSRETDNLGVKSARYSIF